MIKFSKEKVLLLLLMQPLDKLRHAGQDPVSVIDHAVHIADEALFPVEIHGCVRIHNDTRLSSFGWSLSLLYHAARKTSMGEMIKTDMGKAGRFHPPERAALSPYTSS